jgi:hypothetical protein
MSEHVSNAPLREHAQKMIAQGHTWNELATFCGSTKPSGSRLKRRLGLIPEANKICETIQYETAVRIAHSLNMDPIDAGV